MKRFTTRFLVAMLTFIFGISAFAGWLTLRHAKYSATIQPEISETESQPKVEWAQLMPLLQRHNLTASQPDNNHEVPDIEEADARLFSPLAGETIFLQAQSPTADSKELKPRYWLRVEDYSSSELAQQRAREYLTEGANERIARAYGHGVDEHVISKLSLRIWAIARGKRVYALTTNVYLFELIKLPEQLKESVSQLPEI